MPLHPFAPLRGRLETFTLTSKHLERNLLGDPSTRVVTVYLPESYDSKKRSYPLFMSLAAFTGSGSKQLAWNAYEENFPQRLERLIQEQKMGEVIMVFPDCFTSLGGNQYVNSEAMGYWADYINEDVLEAVDKRYRTLGNRESRAVFGKSSGGYGALTFGMNYPQNWSAVACQSGDIDFELLYKAELPLCQTKLASYNGSIQKFLEDFEKKENLSGSDFCTLMELAMAASYAPNKKSYKGIELPIDPHSCEINETLWAKWLEHDPLHRIEKPEAQRSLASLSTLFIDCGFRDQYHLHYGARKFVRKLNNYKIPHHYEEFDGTHSKINHRLDRSLPFLYQNLTVN